VERTTNTVIREGERGFCAFLLLDVWGQNVRVYGGKVSNCDSFITAVTGSFSVNKTKSRQNYVYLH
jgi:hypothetical protein